MQNDFPFQPVPTAANTLAQAVTATNATFTLPTPGTNSGQSIVLTNIGTQTVFWAWGTVTSTATTSMPLIANTAQTFSLPPGVTTISIIAANTGSTLYATLGTGL